MKNDRVAIHEAGHAVVCAHLKFPVGKVTIRPKKNQWEGMCEQGNRSYPTFSYNPETDTYQPVDVERLKRKDYFNRSVVLLAGGIADQLRYGGRAQGLDGDLDILDKILCRMQVTQTEADRWIARAQKRATKILHDRFEAVIRVADALLENTTLSGAEVEKLIRQKS